VPTGRLEAFSDGVIAIAITLLVLDIRVPSPGGGGLGHALAHEWPSYAAYAVSFLTIGIIWINHHAMVGRLRRADHGLLVINLLLLLSIGVLPFTTSLMATYLRESSGEHLAAFVYGGSLTVMACTFFAMQRYVLARGRGLTEIDDATRAFILRRNVVGLFPYALATALAPVSPYATLVICGAIAIYYALPARS
jgi:uncharacterized membrane protein